MRSLIVGDGYLAATLAEQLRQSGVSVERAPRPDRPELDHLLGAQPLDQIVLASPGPRTDELVHRVDGPRWLACSWAGALGVPANSAMLERGGTLLRLSAVFGHGSDDNVTRIARCLRRYRTLIGAGNGAPLVQPLHVDDLVALVGFHLRCPSSGYFEIAGAEAVPVVELCRGIVEVLGIRPIGQVSSPLPRVLHGRGIRARAAIDWRDSDAPVDTHPAREQFGWSPLALGIRLEQAVHEALA